jgi:formiminoglutamate deiminase
LGALWFETAKVASGWARSVRVVVADGEIASVEVGAAPAPGDERHGLVTPGLPNLHSHAFQRAMAGTAERRGPGADNFWSWRTAMYEVAGAIGPEELEAVAAWAYAEMLEAGFVRVGEFHYLHNDRDGQPYADPAEMSRRIAAAAERTGIDLTLLPVFYAHAGFGGAPPSERQRRFVLDLEDYGRLIEAAKTACRRLPGAVVGIAPHSLRAVTEAELRALLEAFPAGPVHIHIAEQTEEVEDCLAWCGQRPMAFLHDRFEIGDRWCLVHATHVEPGELQAVADSGAVVGLCPITEANLGDGLFPAADFLARGGRIGVGSDSNVLIDAAEELRLLEYGQRLVRRERNVLAVAGRSVGETLFEHTLQGGGQALGVTSGGIAVGEPATFVSVDLTHPSLAEAEPIDVLDRWIFAARPSPVDCVWVRGEKVVSGGRHRDRDRLLAGWRGAMAALKARRS